MTVRSLPVLREAPSDLNPLADELQQKMAAHEDAAHEKRNWVRLSFDCNNHCTFCLDTNAHDGTMRSDRDVRVQIVEGRKKGSTRLILSGGEPTMHPLFLDYVALGRKAGYPWIQTVTNGRMFRYPDFLGRALDNGLTEITFSLHGHTAKLHDALVGTPGAFVDEVAGLKAALATERVVVNVDIVINKMNVKHLPEMLDTFIGWGVKEFDLLHVIPFGNAWTEARHHLFYNLDDPEIIAALRKTMAFTRRPDLHIWLNRFPPPYTEGYEELIQDPYKLNDEVRGRREEYDKYLSVGQPLHCRQRERCQYCYLQNLCDSLDEVIDNRKSPEVETIRFDGSRPGLGTLPKARIAHIVAANLEAARPLSDKAEATELALELASYDGLEAALSPAGEVFGKRLVRAVARDAATMAALLAIPGDFLVATHLNQATAAEVLKLGTLPSRLVLVQPNYDLVTEAKSNDVDLPAFFAELGQPAATENIAPCLSPGAVHLRPEPRPRELDVAMLAEDARIDMTRYTKRYVQAGFYSKSVRCSGCAKTDQCRGMHINWVRAHGYSPMTPMPSSEEAAAEE
jgi:MoaA/NifB/PqqE/SkfB family radical SAM enzyme